MVHLPGCKQPIRLVVCGFLVLFTTISRVTSQGTIPGALYQFAHVSGCWTSCVLNQLKTVPALCPSGYYEGRFTEQCSNCKDWKCPCSTTSTWAECAHHYKYNWGCPPTKHLYLAYRTRECLPCDTSCTECTGPAKSDCTSCVPGKMSVNNKCTDVEYVFGATTCSSSCNSAPSLPGACPSGFSEVNRAVACSAGCTTTYCQACSDWASCARRDNVFSGCPTGSSTASYYVKQCARCRTTPCPSCQCDLCPTATQYVQGGTCVAACSTGYRLVSSSKTDRACLKDAIDHCKTTPCQNGGTCTNYYMGTGCTCAPGFTGTRCETNNDECQSSPCIQGTCVDGVNSYSCKCKPGYASTRCNIDINECVTGPCGSGGVCTNTYGSFTCSCHAGYAGPTCAVNVDDCATSPCKNGATCLDLVNNYVCTCSPGYTGKNCTINVNECASSPCANGGTCVDRVNGYICLCQPGYTGTWCSCDINECLSSPCMNAGTCVDGIDAYVCACRTGYTGRHCGSDVDECASSPCLRGGTCIDKLAGFQCMCPPGITGFTCHGDVDECKALPCQNGAMCLNTVGGYACSCSIGYTGSHCAVEINECSSAPCHNGGTCVDQIGKYACTCPVGYTGSVCDVDIDDCSPTPCLNQGSCTDLVNDYTCSCVAGFTGRTCNFNIDDCAAQPAPCSGHGTCTDGINTYTCQCNSGYTGPRCSVDIDDCSPNPCQNGAQCTDGVSKYTCTCATGFTGSDCSTNVDDCVPPPCRNLGVCVDKVANYSCSCLTGFAGRHCQTNVDDCFTRPCRNSGVCQDGINTFTCQCAPGYYGQVCENVQPTTAAPWRPTTAHPTTPRPTTSVTTSPPTTSGPSASSSSEPSTATSQEATTKSQPTKSAVGNNDEQTDGDSKLGVPVIAGAAGGAALLLAALAIILLIVYRRRNRCAKATHFVNAGFDDYSNETLDRSPKEKKDNPYSKHPETNGSGPAVKLNTGTSSDQVQVHYSVNQQQTADGHYEAPEQSQQGQDPLKPVSLAASMQAESNYYQLKPTHLDQHRQLPQCPGDNKTGPNAMKPGSAANPTSEAASDAADHMYGQSRSDEDVYDNGELGPYDLDATTTTRLIPGSDADCNDVYDNNELGPGETAHALPTTPMLPERNPVKGVQPSPRPRAKDEDPANPFSKSHGLHGRGPALKLNLAAGPSQVQQYYSSSRPSSTADTYWQVSEGRSGASSPLFGQASSDAGDGDTYDNGDLGTDPTTAVSRAKEALPENNCFQLEPQTKHVDRGRQLPTPPGESTQASTLKPVSLMRANTAREEMYSQLDSSRSNGGGGGGGGSLKPVTLTESTSSDTTYYQLKTGPPAKRVARTAGRK
ncbi:fibropellin-1-like [Sycon ciliatum]|uniref:fibropellin-1-like n=1 Tax=Sycon ciliatum TaxID=27933 RepID=UPI0031F65987